LGLVEQWRKRDYPPFSEDGDAFGTFFIPTGNKHPAYHPSGEESLIVIASSNDPDWHHVTVHLLHRCPTWEEMAFVKRAFFGDEVVAVQYHPKESEYINTHPFMLHLWSYQKDIPMPDLRKVLGPANSGESYKIED
jgi:hypothetical protein